MKKVNPLTRRAVNLEYKDAPGKSVAVAGSFNQWQSDKMMTDKNGDGVYRCRLLLTPGEYQYKISGGWRMEIRCLESGFCPQ